MKGKPIKRQVGLRQNYYFKISNKIKHSMFYGKYILAQIYILTIRIVTIEILQGLFHIPIINNYNGVTTNGVFNN